MPLHSTNPATGEILRSVNTLTEDGLRDRISLAAKAAEEQRAIPVEHLALALRKFAALLEDECEDAARTVTQETGKPIRAARDEVARCVDACRYYAEHGPQMLAPDLLPGSSGSAYVQWSPVGVILAVLPWESPLWRGVQYAAPALLAGNAVLLKHAASVPGSALLLEALVRRAGFTQGALAALIVDDALVEAALHDERVVRVAVCGSETAARALAAQAGWLLKKATLHLPGSDPLIIMPSADLEAAVASAVHALAAAASSAKRLIVHTAVYEEAAKLLVQALEALRVGDPMKEDTDVGPVGTPDALAALEEQVQAAVKAGGRVLTGGTRLIGTGNFFEPTLLGDVPRASAVARDAFTGPLALIFRADDLQDAVACANETPFNRSASLWTREPGEQQQLIDAVRAKSIALNALPYESAPPPADRGERHTYQAGPVGIREWMQAKTVLLR